MSLISLTNTTSREKKNKINCYLPLECRCLALVSHHHHRCLSSFFYSSHSELNFCGSHKCTDVSPGRTKRRLSIKPTLWISQTEMHADTQPLSAHSRINRVGEAFLLAHFKWRECAAAPWHGWAPGWLKCCSAGLRSPQRTQPSLLPSLQTKHKLSVLLCRAKPRLSFPRLYPPLPGLLPLPGVLTQHTYFYFLSFLFLTTFPLAGLCALWELWARTSGGSAALGAFRGQ